MSDDTRRVDMLIETARAFIANAAGDYGIDARENDHQVLLACIDRQHEVIIDLARHVARLERRLNDLEDRHSALAHAYNDQMESLP